MLIRRVPANAVPDRVLVPRQKRFTTRRAYFPHAAWLGQGSPHCPISLTAASRRSLVRVSVPVWGTVLSDPLPIVALVGRCPANQLMGRMPVRVRPKPFDPRGCPQKSAWGITRRFHRLSPGRGLVAYALRTRAPLSEAPKDPLPFDLHVLGLPLAFILSQDQTLHCIIVVLYLFPVLGLRYVFLTFAFFYLAFLFIVLASSFQRTFCLTPPFLGGENGCKITTFFLSRKLFFTFFSKIFLLSDYQ